MRIVFEDADVLVVDKPPGLLTATEPGQDRENLFDLLKRYIRATRGRGPRRDRDSDEPRSRSAGQGCYIIHRLDKDASGLLVFATSEKAFTWLKEDFKAKRVHRIYTALCAGTLGQPNDQGTIQSFLKEDEHGHARSIPSDEFRGAGPGSVGGVAKETARLAVTHYRVVAVGQGLSLVQVRLDTGRKNQIRAHLSEKGHPLVGDYRYGSKADPLQRLGLHAGELGFTHPGTGQTVRYFAPAPPGFYRAVGATPPPASMSRVLPVSAAKAGDGGAGGSGSPDTAWENVAGWYDALLSEHRSDHYDRVIIPGTVRLVQPRGEEKILDVACGQGVISRAMAALGAGVLGVDGSPSLVEAAQAKGGPIDYRVGDARTLDVEGLRAFAPEGFDAATCVMALGNIEPIEPVFRAVCSLLKPGGRFVAVLSHPSFRAPGQTSWGWDNKQHRQFRRVDGYLSPGQHAIEMQPGRAAAGEGSVKTWTFHRPLQHYIKHLGEAGLLVEQLEEWPGQRVSQPGPRAEEENRARREIPLFLAIRAVKR